LKRSNIGVLGWLARLDMAHFMLFLSPEFKRWEINSGPFSYAGRQVCLANRELLQTPSHVAQLAKKYPLNPQGFALKSSITFKVPKGSAIGRVSS